MEKEADSCFRGYQRSDGADGEIRTVQAGSKRLLKRGGGEVWRRGLPYAFRIYAEKI